MSTTTPWPVVDESFTEHVATRRPMRFEHALGRHPLLQLDAVADLAEQLAPDSVSTEPARKALVADDWSADAVPIDAVRELVGERIRRIAEGDSWFSLLHVERDAAYRGLVEEVLDAVADQAQMAREALRHRMGFVFASSPGSVTSAHVDVEHSLLVQLQGRRTLSLGRFADADHRAEEVRRYWAGRFGRLDQLPEVLETHQLGPGVGAYIPPWCPHWIINGDEPSLSLTVTFFTADSARETRVQAFNHRVGRLGVTARPYGSAPVRDWAKAAAMGAVSAVKRLRDPTPSPFG